MDIFDTFATDPVAEIEGRWVPLGKDASVLVARASNERYLKLLRKRLEQAGTDLTSKSPEVEAEVEAIDVAVQAETILLGWKGLTFKQVPLEYSLENSLKFMNVRDFRLKIQKIAADMENFRLAAEEKLGNDSETT